MDEFECPIALPVSQEAQGVLIQTFGFSDFRDRQAEIVDGVIKGQNALVVMPTGGGKSLCYQIPSLVREGLGVVVSPLIALMQDQVSGLVSQGVRAAFMNSTLDTGQYLALERRIASGELDILYLAPERLLQPRTLDLLDAIPISLFAIDEAHCVAQWGHDFRVDYLRLKLLVDRYPQVPRLALTATADVRTQREIALCLSVDKHFICGFDRSNIEYRIRQKSNPRKQLLNFLHNEQQGNAGVVYCLSRNKVDDIAIWLQEQDIVALPYHAGMTARDRQYNQNRFLREEGIVIVATIAFGMGIDKPNVRFVAHLDMPKSVEAYYQETGRAGRDGEPATAILFYGMEDVVKLSQMLDKSEGDESHKRMERQRLNAMLGLCEMTACRRQALLRYFGEELKHACGNCDNCLQPPETWDATEAVQKALSCVYRTGQRFGAAHVIDVLRGANTGKIRQFNHQRLSTYGIGQELSPDNWRSLFRQLLVLGYLEVDTRGYGNLLLAEKCRVVLRGEKSIELHKEIQRDKKTTAKKTNADLMPEDQPLWHALRVRRKALAEENGVPPYVVFSDATLKEMVAKRPLSEEELLCVNGVGDKKLEKYGTIFLHIIQQYEYQQ